MGGGFIGLELAENLTERGLKVTIVELADQVLAPLDVELAALVEKHLAEHGVARAHRRVGQRDRRVAESRAVHR